MDRRLERGETTRVQILGAATELFAQQGYEAVSIDAILQASAISKGALYHHFKSKEALFTAVLDAAEARVGLTLAASAATATSPREALYQGAAAWLALAATDAVVRRVVLIDAPAAVGWQAWRAISNRHTLGLLKLALDAAAQAGALEAGQVEVSAHLLMAIMVEAALLVARAPEDPAVAASALTNIERVIAGLLSSAEPPATTTLR